MNDKVNNVDRDILKNAEKMQEYNPRDDTKAIKTNMLIAFKIKVAVDIGT
jgi:hypothetical protein